MYRQWPFFQATIDNAATALAKADMYVGQCYSELCTNAEQRGAIWRLIASERDRSRQAILDIVGGSELLATTPWFQGSIEVRNPYVCVTELRIASQPDDPSRHRASLRIEWPIEVADALAPSVAAGKEAP